MGMDVLNAVTNITCDFIKQNKNISGEDVLAFMDAALLRLRKYDKNFESSVELPDPPQNDSRTVTIMLGH